MMLGLNETLDQLAMANSVCWYGHFLRLDDDHVWRRALVFEVEGHRNKRRPKKEHRKSRLMKKHKVCPEQGRSTLLMNVDC